MKGSFLWKLMWLFCALAGCLAGYGIFYLTGTEEMQWNKDAKDNTLVQEFMDGVFFSRSKEDGKLENAEEKGRSGQENGTSYNVQPQIIPAAVPTVEPVMEPEKKEAGRTEEPEKKEIVPSGTVPPVMPVEPLDEQSSGATSEIQPSTEQQGELLPAIIPQDNTLTEENGDKSLPSLSEVLSSGEHVWEETVTKPDAQDRASLEEGEEKTNLVQQGELPSEETTEVITYPTKIFGQVPVINRSDAYVSYFEFCYDLVAMLEKKVEQRGWNMNALLAKFAIKALFCGVDIEKLDINAPIPRKEAALTLWLAAQILEEGGSNTSAYTAQNYVMDLNGCSGSEKKAVAYLYEQGILSGYQSAGQTFFPTSGLETKAGEVWLSRANQCWK